MNSSLLLFLIALMETFAPHPLRKFCYFNNGCRFSIQFGIWYGDSNYACKTKIFTPIDSRIADSLIESTYMQILTLSLVWADLHLKLKLMFISLAAYK